MKTLYEASNAVEAHMLLDLLKQEGLAAHIHGEALQGAIGELPAAGLVRLVVDEECYAPARAVIERWERTRAEATPLRKPAASSRGLHGFLLGLVLGVGGTYAAYKTPVSTEGIDYNRDGLLDEKWTYSPNGTMLKVEADRNLDRKVDYVARYDSRGLIESAEADDNFDGFFETRQRFRDGNMQFAETDSDGDGYPDLRSLYSNGVLDTIEHINPASGLPLRSEKYRLGILQFADIDSNKDGTLDLRIRYTALFDVASKEPLSK